ncbi:MAG: inositol monophosphatase family protein [Candidatus Freyarchaeota archaeon]
MAGLTCLDVRGFFVERYVSFLVDLLERARVRLLREWRGERGVVGVNVKGDETRGFDFRVEEYLVREIRGRWGRVGFFAEEEGEVEGEAPFFVLDPVDGSTNFLRRVGVCSISVAVAEEPYLESARVGVVKNVLSGETYHAVKGGGAFLDGVPIAPSNTVSLDGAVVGVDLDFPDKEDLRKVLPLMLRARKIRKVGSNALEISYVAHGGYDAFVDVRNLLTCESFLAAKVILEEAGGKVTDERGAPIRGEIRLEKKWNIIAAANSTLHGEILAVLRGGRVPLRF